MVVVWCGTTEVWSGVVVMVAWWWSSVPVINVRVVGSGGGVLW